MAHGMRDGISFFPLKIWGKAELNDVAAWIAGNAILPIQLLSLKPKMPLAWLSVTHFHIWQTVL